MIERDVMEVTRIYHDAANTATPHLRGREEQHSSIDCLQYFFPTALEVIKQGSQLRQQLVEVMLSECIAPQRALCSLQACVVAILEGYYTQHIHNIHVERLEDYMVSVSFRHLQYAIIHVLHFLHAHRRQEQICMWITQQEGIYLRLSGQALSSTLVQDLFSLFPPNAYAKHMGLALSRLLLEAHGGQLLCKTHALPHEAYTEFTIILPMADPLQVTGSGASNT